MKPKWLKDIEAYVGAVPYGTVSIPEITRVNHKTVQVTTVGTETLRYVDNEEAIEDLVKFIRSLLDEDYSGVVQFSVKVKSGKIKELGITSVKQTQYGN